MGLRGSHGILSTQSHILNTYRLDLEILGQEVRGQRPSHLCSTDSLGRAVPRSSVPPCQLTWRRLGLGPSSPVPTPLFPHRAMARFLTLCKSSSCVIIISLRPAPTTLFISVISSSNPPCSVLLFFPFFFLPQYFNTVYFLSPLPLECERIEIFVLKRAPST